MNRSSVSYGSCSDLAMEGHYDGTEQIYALDEKSNFGSARNEIA